MKKNIPKRGIIVTVGTFVSIVIIIIYFALWSSNNFSPSPQIITINKGAAFNHIVDSLAEKNIISSKLLFKIVGKIFGYTEKMKAGKYSFNSGVSNIEILKNIVSGKSLLNISVTIHEGLQSRQIAKILKKEIGIDSARFMVLLSDTSILDSLNIRTTSLEGFLSPNTYNFIWQQEEKDIIAKMVGEFKKFYNDSLQQQCRKIGMSLSELITMASIVEGEAMLDSERARIAGLYYNRLRKKMPLAADPTIQYIIPDGPRRLFYKDLKIQSPYNTYINRGLPPGPINNPGKKSILAALYPEKNPYLYFVADGYGGHRFAKTYSEHLKNVSLYRKTRAMLASRK